MSPRFKFEYDKEGTIISRIHLDSLLSLSQFSRCWHIIKSHLILYDRLDELRKQIKVQRKRKD
jgi:hypothetical protein